MEAAASASLRRSFVHAKLVAAGARLAPVRGGLAAMDYGDPAAEQAALASLALVDVSPLPRVGFKGRGTPEWLAGEGVRLPEPNLALRQEDGTLAVRLAPREALLLAPLTGDADPTARLEPAWREARRNGPGEALGYPVPRADSHAWFLVTGEHAPAMFAKICGVDLRPDRFAPLRVAQTQAMRLSVVVIRDDGERLAAWHLLLDSASAEYAWDCLLDAMAEFGGKPAGLAALG